jgi:hypothetical protein
MTGAAPDELIELRSHQMPCGTDYLWEWFLRLSSTRASGFGVSAISELELRAFFSNRSIVPTQWELDTLIRMDRTAREASVEDKKPQSDVEE